MSIVAGIAESSASASRIRMMRRLSIMSASAPAGSANRNIGRLAATCTKDTIKGSELRLVMSQPAAALYIQLPKLVMMVAIQSALKTECRNGLHGDVIIRGHVGRGRRDSFVFPTIIRAL